MARNKTERDRITAELFKIAKTNLLVHDDVTSFVPTRTGKDFVEGAVWCVEKALREAYEAGRRDGGGK